MIYTSVKEIEPIRQGDIFFNLPFVRYNLRELYVYFNENEFNLTSWIDVKENTINGVANFEKVYGIVLSQDCDCLRNPYLSLIMIIPYNRNFTSVKRGMQEILIINNRSPSLMYLPPDNNFRIREKMLIDFSQIFHIFREDLEYFKKLRLCRLNSEGLEHFCNKVSDYFRRYAYDEYYPFDPEEMDEYENYRKEKYERRVYQTKK